MAVDGQIGTVTERQRQVLALVAKGRSNREIGGELGISEDGVKAHLSRLFLRFGVTNRVELLAASGASLFNDHLSSETADLGALRAIAGRANTSADGLRGADGSASLAAQLTAVRDALAAVDLALDLVRELPPETTGALVAALRKRLATAFDALEMAEQSTALARS